MPATQPVVTDLAGLQATLYAFAGIALTIVGNKVLNAVRRWKFGGPDLDAVHAGDLQLQDVLTEARGELRARRVYLVKFHNGEEYADGSHIQKYSRTHESVAAGTSYQADDYKGVLHSQVPDEMALIREPGPGFRVVADLPTGKFRWLCEQGGAGAVARFAIRKGKAIVGYLGVDFGPDVSAAPAALQQMPLFAARIENLMAAQA